MYKVYILKSINSNHYYVGQTDNIEQRIKLHNQGKVYWTSRYRPWKIHYIEEYQTRPDAMKREKYFKSHSGRKFIKTILDD